LLQPDPFMKGIETEMFDKVDPIELDHVHLAPNSTALTSFSRTMGRMYDLDRLTIAHGCFPRSETFPAAGKNFGNELNLEIIPWQASVSGLHVPVQCLQQR
jgi:hypothetical protein